MKNRIHEKITLQHYSKDRLTKRTVDSFGIHQAVVIEPVKQSCCTGCKNDCDDCSFKKSIDKLAEYEDLEEQGLLLRLPCEVGGTAYTIYDNGEDEPQIETRKVFEVSTTRIWLDGSNYCFSRDYLGKDIFLTREAVEKAFEERSKQ